jgi:hypothetical protein
MFTEHPCACDYCSSSTGILRSTAVITDRGTEQPDWFMCSLAMLSGAQASCCTMPCEKTTTWKTKTYGGTVLMDLRETVCESGRWMELIQDRVQWRALVLVI